MESNGTSRGSSSNNNNFYNYLIRPDQRATRQLEDLCLGLAKIIADLDPGTHPDNELTPQRLAAFYRRLGGNYDTLFLSTTEDGLSFMYRTLGCYHSLQPTRSPFETPRIPCLTPTGYARWQTIQLMLTPHEHVPFLQKAVQTFDVPRPDGGYFPKNLPRECLPDRPDEAMEKWYRHVTGSLNQENYMRRLKNSPSQSPYLDPQDRRDSYFLNGQMTPGKSSRIDSYDDEQARLAAYRRRSSVPDIVSPPASADRGSHWDPNNQQHRKARSHSATRASHHQRQRSHTTNAAEQHHRSPESPATSKRYGSNPLDLSRISSSRPTSQQYSHPSSRPPGRRPKSPSTVDEDTGSEGSSEASQNGHYRRQRKSDEERASRKSLWVPSFLRSSHKRRHSSEGRLRAIEAAKPPLPLRPEYYSAKRQHVASPAVPPTHAPPVMPPSHRPPPQNGVRFRSDMFDDAMHSAPESPASVPPPSANGLPPPVIRYPEPTPPNSGYPTQQLEDMSMMGKIPSHDSSGSGTDRRYHSGSDWDRNTRKAGQPTRVKTVTGVHGRAYPNADISTAERQHATRPRGSVPTTVV